MHTTSDDTDECSSSHLQIFLVTSTPIIPATKDGKNRSRFHEFFFPPDTYFIPPKLVKQSPCLHMEIPHTHKIALYG
jgi:hypothetical protein